MNKVKSFSKLFGILILSILILQSCSKKIAVFSKSYSAKDLNIEKLDFDYLTIKSKIAFKETHKTTKATALIRIKKDSVIWFNLTGALGIQGVRGIITRDSVKILNKVDKTYYLYDFEEVSKEFKFPIDYRLIQSMIVGDMPKPLDDSNSIKLNNGRYIIKQNIENIKIINFVNQQSMKLEEVNVTEVETDNSLKLLYKDFKDVNGQGLPFSIFISLMHQNKFGELETQLNIDHIRAEPSDKPLRFPFSIPKKYEAK
ncbi:MAG: DUF4292 domain-containing protein [Cyclobacteriaceae bacterium]|nr:DUF4292 domain-containing protein [Cyclobacteriaceae bacterium]